jgi:hypothetical protein
VWPGYEGSILHLEGGPLLLVDVMHKVINTRSVYEVIQELWERGDRGTYRDRCNRAIVGQIVVTRLLFQ